MAANAGTRNMAPSPAIRQFRKVTNDVRNGKNFTVTFRQCGGVSAEKSKADRAPAAAEQAARKRSCVTIRARAALSAAVQPDPGQPHECSGANRIACS